MKLIYSGNASKGSVEYSIDAGSTFVPVTLAELKNGVELITNDLANIRVRAGSNVFENISVLKKFKVVESEDKTININYITRGNNSSGITDSLEYDRQVSNLPYNVAAFIDENHFIPLNCSSYSADINESLYYSGKYTYEITSYGELNYNYHENSEELYSTLAGKDLKIFEFISNMTDDSGTIRGSFVFKDTGYIFHINDYIDETESEDEENN